jgi:MarR-like DNA-binding transcriptional regulator SgrR of sgrS sRNA
MTDRLEQRVREHYEAQKLSADALERLTKILEEQRRFAAPSRGSWSRWKWLSMAASLLLVGLATFLLVQLSDRREHRVRLDIARQAARVHNLRLEVEVPATTYAEVRIKMSNLDFSPAQPAEFGAMHMRLIGARYDSLQGQPAVQMKLADSEGEICTLTEARPVDQLAAIDRRSRHHIDGLIVDIWREKGLVMVLTRPIA